MNTPSLLHCAALLVGTLTLTALTAPASHGATPQQIACELHELSADLHHDYECELRHRRSPCQHEHAFLKQLCELREATADLEQAMLAGHDLPCINAQSAAVQCALQNAVRHSLRVSLPTRTRLDLARFDDTLACLLATLAPDIHPPPLSENHVAPHAVSPEAAVVGLLLELLNRHR